MILQALYEYAQRKGDELPEDGFENIEIKYLIKIKEDGSFVGIESTEEKIKQENGKEKSIWKTFDKVPKHVARTAAPKASLLIDNVGYVLGIPKVEKEEKKIKKAEESAKIQNELFIKAIEELPENIRQEKEISAIIKFYRENKGNGFEKTYLDENYEDVKKCLGNVSFILIGNNDIVAQNEKVREYQRQQTSLQLESSNDSIIATCLITGEKSVISRLHSATAIRNSQATAPLVGFNNQAFESYGKKQSFNAPVSLRAESAYTKALKYLLKSDKNRILLGSDTVVFWAEKENPVYSLEDSFGSFFSLQFEDNPDKSVNEVKNLFDSIETGKISKIDSNFYVLGLSPNSGRISVRFWETGKISEFAERIKQHFEDYEIIHADFEKKYLNLYQILAATALEYKLDNVAPNLIGNVMQSILKGKNVPYPQTLQQQCIRRIRAEQKVTRERAAILKAYLNRINRINGKEEVTVSLNRECTDKGYLIGRLFAVLEKVQQDTHSGLNATITDRYYGAASTNPVTVFAQLLKLNQHHLANYENRALKVVREKEIGEIMNLIETFPSHLTLDEQSMFAIGYYHERQSFFEKKETENFIEENK